jgi:hypothetical protein
MRLRREYVHENGGSMPFDALSAKARLMVPVGAIERRCELRIPCCLIFCLISAGVEERERAALARELDRCEVGPIAHRLRDPRRHRARFRGVVPQAQHDQRVAEPGVAEPDPALRHRLGVLLRQRPRRHLEHVVEHPHRDLAHPAERGEVELRLVGERTLHELREVDRAEVAAAVGGQRLLAARVRALDRLAVVEVVVLVHAVEEEHARLGVVVGRAHDLVPQAPCAQLAVDPLPVGALVGTRFLRVGRRLGLVHELEVAVLLHRPHELVGHADRDVEVGQLALVLGVDEVLDVGVVAAEHPHLRAAARAGRLDRLARAVEHAHVRHRSARARHRAVHERALRPDRREVVADAAAAAHRFRRLGERGVDAGPAVDDLGDRVADRLHEAVDQGRGERRAGRGVDASGGDEAALLRVVELRFPLRALVFGLGHRERACDAATDVLNRALLPFGVLLDQDLARDLLLGERRERLGLLALIRGFNGLHWRSRFSL